MKRLIVLLAVFLFLMFAGCDSGLTGDGENVSYDNQSTIAIGLTGRTYEYTDVYDQTGRFYRMYYVYTGLVLDTVYINVPENDTITIRFYDTNSDSVKTTNIMTFHPVPDSTYKFKF